MLEAKIDSLEKDPKECHQCSNLDTTKENPQEHIQNKHESDNLPENITCESCAKTFPTSELQTHHNNEVHVNICDQFGKKLLFSCPEQLYRLPCPLVGPLVPWSLDLLKL